MALAIRVDGIGQPPLDFAPTRQYHSALVARAMYLEDRKSVPQHDRDLAAAARDQQEQVEPPVMEWVAARVYAATDGERLWFPRLLSALFWVTSAVFLYRLALRVTSGTGALIALALFLFFPFGIFASRSFQPDPLMMMLLLAGMLAVARYHERPGQTRFAAATLVSAAAVLSKPGIALFFLAPLFASLAIERLGLHRALSSPQLYAFSALSAVPAFLYYLYGTQIEDFLRGQAGAKVLPQLLVDPAFWSGWLKMAAQVMSFTGPVAVVGLGVIALALVGLARVPRGRPRAILLGLLAGYVLFGLVFTYHIHTHHYYSLPLIAIASLSLGHLGGLALPRVPEAFGPYAVAIVGLAGLLCAGLLGWAVHSRLTDPAYERRVSAFERIGESVNHSSRLLFLSEHYGLPLKYHGHVAGLYWPNESDLREERLHGLEEITPAQRLRGTNPDYYPAVGALRPPPESFVVTDLSELRAQQDLRRHLFERFSSTAPTADSLVFDLRGRR